MNQLPVGVCLALLQLVARSAVGAVDQSDDASPRPFSESLELRTDRKSVGNSGGDKPSFSESFAQRGAEKAQRTSTARRADEVAVQQWRREIAKDPGRRASFLSLGKSLLRLERIPEAMTAFQRALWFNPIDANAHLGIGTCLYREGNFAEAATSLQRASWYNPRNLAPYRWLGYSLYHLRNYSDAASALDRLLQRKPGDFDAQYWRGSALMAAGRYEEAAQSLGKAVELRHDDFDANYWCGSALLRAGRFREAVVNLEQANALRPSSITARQLLLAAYAGAGEFNKGFRLFPGVVAVVGIGLCGIYVFGLAILCWFSFRIGKSSFPPVSLTLGWLALMVEGQLALIFPFAFFSSAANPNSTLLAVLISGLPLVGAAVFGFRRKPWGAPFRSPVRFGGLKTIALAMLFLVLIFAFNVVFEKLMALNPSYHRPMQKSMVFLREAMAASPLLGLLTIAFVVPIAEEIVFRGLLFGSLQRWFRVRWIVPLTALVFAVIHLDIFFLLPLLFLGLILGWARARTGSLGLPIFLHCLNNCLALIGAYSAGWR